MIISRLRGGLGNQMFQYAAGRAHAMADGERLAMDLSCYVNADRTFELQSYEILPDIQFIGRWRALIMKIAGATYLDGFFEDKQYALSICDILLKEFSLRNPGRAFLEQSRDLGNNTLGIHVRRGDFLKTPGKVVLGVEYYKRAVDELLQKAQPSRIIVCTDDKEWCRMQIPFIGGRRADIIDAGMSAPEELALLAQCKYLIMSDSTFSWWAGFLGSRRGQIVLTPARWYTDAKKNAATVQSLILPEWIMIE